MSQILLASIKWQMNSCRNTLVSLDVWPLKTKDMGSIFSFLLKAYTPIHFYYLCLGSFLLPFKTDHGVIGRTFPNKTAILCLQRPLFKEATLIQMLSWELYIQTSLLLILPPEIASPIGHNQYFMSQYALIIILMQ